MPNEIPSNAPQKTTASGTVRIEDQDVVSGTPIRTIFSRPTGRRDSNRTQKAHVREARSTHRVFIVNLVSRPKKKPSGKKNTSTPE